MVFPLQLIGDVQALNIGSKELNGKYKQSPNKGMSAKGKNETRNQKNTHNECLINLEFDLIFC